MMIDGIGVGWRDEVPEGMWLAYGRGAEPLNLVVIGHGDVADFELLAGAVKVDLSRRDYEALRDRLVTEDPGSQSGAGA